MRVLRHPLSPKSRPLLVALVGAACAGALAASAMGSSSRHASPGAYVPAPLLAAGRDNPSHVFRVIVQGAGGHGEARVVAAVRANGASLDRRLRTISGASAAVTGRQLLRLAAAQGVAAITLDRPVRLTGGLLWSRQRWPYAVGADKEWAATMSGRLPTPPAIAIVDSGIQADRPDFGARILRQIDLVHTGTPNSYGDGYGHGTFVAGLAAGGAPGIAGAAPSAPVVSLDVLDDQGSGLTSDVIAACDWIVRHKAQYDIKVANLSLQSTAPASVFWDPLDQAVERLWFDGVTVVASSGNYAVDGKASGVLYAPGNDPFAITVGADDIGGTLSPQDDTAAPWSAYGYTYDGFAKPELGAPGRYLIGPVPNTSTLATTRPDSMVAPGYEYLSGTSFAAPIVSAAAAYLLALHPRWTPDQVKGALMLSARPEPSAVPLSQGVGLVNLGAAGQVGSPPNANLALDRFVHRVPGAGPIPVFDSAAWQATALMNPQWDAPTWNAAAWGSAAWGSAAWGSAAWGSAAWGSAAWGSSALAQSLTSSNAAWGSAAWGSATTTDVVSDWP